MRLHPSPSSTPPATSSDTASAGAPPVERPAAPSPSTSPASAEVAIDIYRSTSDRSKYLSVVAGTDLASMAFPADVDVDLHSVSPYKEGVRIQAGTPAMGLDVEDILAQLDRQGFAAHGLKFSASLSMGVGIGRAE